MTPQTGWNATDFFLQSNTFLWQYESTRCWEADNVHAKILQPSR